MTATEPTTAGTAPAVEHHEPPPSVPSFAVIGGAQVRRALAGNEQRIVDLVAQTYRLHGQGDSVNPPSYFLRFADRPSSRIIALPASLGGRHRVDGLKWISSFPGNVAAGVPRASAVLILNDPTTGYPFACLESSIISATRTAASAALAADQLSQRRGRPRRVGFFGTGLIARYIHDFLVATGWSFDEIALYDTAPESAASFAGYLRASTSATDGGRSVTVHPDPEALIRSCDLVVFATTAGQPHVRERSWFAHGPLVLHVSLRDLAPEILVEATNVVDDIDHCLTANTSLHLAEQLCGNRDFVAGTLCEVMTGHRSVPDDGLVVFSPFGLGVLDLAVGNYIYHQARQAGELQVIEQFFHELRRHG